MRINRLLILLLSSEKPIVASARLVERQGLNVLPDLDPLGAAVGGIELLRGIGDGIGNAIGSGAANLFTNPQNPDSSKTEPPPAADTPSDGKTSPNPPAEPFYKMKIDDPILFSENKDAIGPAENLFLNPQNSDSSKTEPPPAADTPSDGKTSPNPSAEPYYKMKIDDPNLFSENKDAIGPAENLFLNPLDSDSSKTEPHPAADTTSDGKTAPISPLFAPNPPAERVYKIKIDNSNGPGSLPLPETKPSPPAILPSVNEECDVNDPDCGKLTDQMVFTTGCATMSLHQVVSDGVKALNQAIYDALSDMNAQNVLTQQGGPGLRTSRMDSICGVFFFVVPLTRAQIQEIEKKPGVRFVSPNRVLKEQVIQANFHPKDREPAAVPAPKVPRSRLQKRSRLVQDPDAGGDLRFISTEVRAHESDDPLSENYLYYKEAGEGSIIFAVGGAVNTLHDDFVRADGERAILALGLKGVDASDVPGGVATCRVSKMVGRTHGVAKKARVMVVNVINTEASLSDGLAQLCDYLGSMPSFRERYAGHYVLSMMQTWDGDDERVIEALDQLLDLLTIELHLVVVVPTGFVGDEEAWPESAAGQKDIIVVGAVDLWGRTLLSRTGPFLTVSGPGEGQCADQPGKTSNFDTYVGPDLAAAATTGMIAYWLSLPGDIDRVLRRNLNIADNVKEFLKLWSYYRVPYGDALAIWNLLPDHGRSII